MTKITKTYTWNEDLQRMENGELTLNPDAQLSPDDIRTKPIDDYSKFLPRGYRRSEKYTAAREARERAEREKEKSRKAKERTETIQRQQAYSDLNEFGSNTDIDIPHNQNRASASEIREDYIWQIPLILLVVFLVGIYIVTHL